MIDANKFYLTLLRELEEVFVDIFGGRGPLTFLAAEQALQRIWPEIEPLTKPSHSLVDMDALLATLREQREQGRRKVMEAMRSLKELAGDW